MTEEPAPPLAFLKPEAIDLVIPPECEAGVAANLRLLAEHHARLHEHLRAADDR